MVPMKPTLIVQATGGLCCLGASISVHVPHSSDIMPQVGAQLTYIGAILCLLVGPVIAFGLGYTAPRSVARLPTHKRAALALSTAFASGFVALVTGVMMGFAGCSVGWM